jgi:hypothetical protein
MFLAWCVLHGMAGELHTDDLADELAKLRARARTQPASRSTGSLRKRLPVSLNTALANAGASGGTALRRGPVPVRDHGHAAALSQEKWSYIHDAVKAILAKTNARAITGLKATAPATIAASAAAPTVMMASCPATCVGVSIAPPTCSISCKFNSCVYAV